MTNALVPANAGPCRGGRCQCVTKPTLDVPKQVGIALESVHHAPANDLPAIDPIVRVSTPLDVVGRRATVDDLSRQSTASLLCAAS